MTPTNVDPAADGATAGPRTPSTGSAGGRGRAPGEGRTGSSSLGPHIDPNGAA